MACLDPRAMANDRTKCWNDFRNLMKHLISVKKIDSDKCRNSLEAIWIVLESIPALGTELFSGFSLFQEKGVDKFLAEKCSGTRYAELFTTVKMFLIVSHGQAKVEHRFSVNKEVEVENLRHQSLVAQRIICDFVKQTGRILNVPITNQLLVNDAWARQKYETYLESERQEKKVSWWM